MDFGLGRVSASHLDGVGRGLLLLGMLRKAALVFSRELSGVADVWNGNVFLE